MKTLRSLVACLSLVLFAQTAVAQDTKIGVLNPLQALFNSDAARIVQEELEQEFSVDEARATELTEQLQALQEEYQQNEAVMTEDEIRRMNSNAQDLQVQPPAVSRQVAGLEHTLGVTLFLRSKPRLSLTSQGQELSFASREMFEEFVRSGDLADTDMVYDAETKGWSPARTHPIVLEVQYAQEEEEAAAAAAEQPDEPAAKRGRKTL